MGFWSDLFNAIFGSHSQTVEDRDAFPGALIDERPAAAVERDYDIREMVGMFEPVQWVEKKPGEIRQFPVQDQRQQNSCVAQTRRKLYRILFKVNRGLDLDFSAAYVYRKRSNYPDAGMGADDAIRISREGVTLEALLTSNQANDAEANKVVIEQYQTDVAQDFKVPNEVTFPDRDFEKVASTIQKTRKGVMVWFFFTSAEWSREVPVIITPGLNPIASSTLRHSVTAVEPALYNGKKGLWIEDSAHFGGLNRRFITEEFFRARCFWASYPINFSFDPQEQKPQHQFLLDLKLGDNSADVKALQICLQYEGCFPTNVEPTGLYGGITAAAVLKFQKKYAVAPAAELDELQGKTVGPKTRAKLNERFA